MFIFRSDIILGEIGRHLPEVDKGLDQARMAMGSPDFESVLDGAFNDMPTISIDYGIMEKVGGIRVIPATISWSDVGSWASLPEVSATDGGGNVVAGDTVAVDAAGCVLKNFGRQALAVVGLRDSAVIVTEDAILVCPLDRTQDVRKAVEELKNRGRRDLL
jgi:mannose-1-phosphate guanylyltransferase